MKNERTQKDYDIISQSSLKAAVELTIGILPRLDNETEISDLVLKLAGKFSTWVLGDTVQNQVDRVHEALNNLDDHPDPDSFNCYQDYTFAENPQIQNYFLEAHVLQDTMGIARTDFFDKCPTHDSWTEGVKPLVKKLRKQIHEGLAKYMNPGGNGKKRNGNGWNGNGGNGNDPISKKQYGFLMGLHRDLGLDPNKDEIDQLTINEASSFIEELKAQRDAA